MNLWPFFILSFILSALVWAKKPNFVFLVSEDNSIHYLKHYGAKFGSMPNVEKMASEGVTFNHAFSNAPVCSVARSTLATGILAPRSGFQYHRKAELATLPEGVLPWSAILRDAGYFCANNRKLDYNFKYIGTKPWDESSNKATWRNRPNTETPFFYMRSMGESHEGSLHFNQTLMEKETTITPVGEVELHPYHPDTSTFRFTHARYHDRMRVIDNLIGSEIKKLKDEGVLEDTFVFYFGDHGGVLPRSKGYAYETGLHVPLVVRIPKNFIHLVDHKNGSRTDGFVSFIDFGPTILHLAGINVPKFMDGSPFFGKGINRKALAKRDESFGYADRFDEKYDMVRSLRKGKWKYIRNYQGFYPDGLQNNYRYRMLAFKEWRELFKDGELNEEQQQFFSSRPAEQLFDLSKDPYEVNDLSKNPVFRKKLIEMRTKLSNRTKEVNDLSFYPESYMIDNALLDPISFGEKRSTEISRLVDVANLALLPFQKVENQLQELLSSGTEWEKYWACLVAAQFGHQAKSLHSLLPELMGDSNLMVQLRAVEAWSLISKKNPMPKLIEIANVSKSRIEVLLVLNSVTFFRDFCGYTLDPSLFAITAPKGEYSRRLEYFADSKDASKK
jgi:arylsulfatase A-like enzyme